MKLYKFIIVIVVLLMLTGTATYILLTSELFEGSTTEVNENTVNAIRETVLQ